MGVNGPLLFLCSNTRARLPVGARALPPCGVACGPAPSGASFQAMVRGVPLGKPPAGTTGAVHSSRTSAGHPSGRQLVPADTRHVARHPVVQPRSPWLSPWGVSRVFANWLPKPPHRYCEESPLRYFKLPRGDETAKMPIEIGDFPTLLRAAEP